MEYKKSYITVGEPWDFESPSGQNIIDGAIIKTVSATCLVFKANYNLEFGEVSGQILILYPRYADSNFNDLKTGSNYITINGNLFHGECNPNTDEQTLMSNSKLAIIGGIKIE